MDMYSKNQYLKALIEKRGYLLKSKKEKSKLLDEYCKTTGLGKKVCLALKGKVEVIGILLDPDEHIKAYITDMFGGQGYRLPL